MILVIDNSRVYHCERVLLRLFEQRILVNDCTIEVRLGEYIEVMDEKEYLDWLKKRNSKIPLIIDY